MAWASEALLASNSARLGASNAQSLHVRTPTRGDFTGDGQSDVMFQRTDGSLAVWLMTGTGLDTGSFVVPDNVGDRNYRIAGSADFNGDGWEDLLFQHVDGTLAVWYMLGATQTGAELVRPSNPADKNWRVAATGDLNEDDQVDLVFQHTDGTLAVWFMDGLKLKSAGLFVPSNPGDKNWRSVGVGDFNADGNTDLLFQHADGSLAVWYLDGLHILATALLNPSQAGDVNWRIVGTPQFEIPLTVSLRGISARPSSVPSTATGSGRLALIGNQLSFNLSHAGLSGAPTAIRIHGPATTEQTAPVLFQLVAEPRGSEDLSGRIELTDETAALMRDGLTYLSISTAAHPAGEIRGQITKSRELAGKVDLLFQHTDGTLAVWFLDGVTVSSIQLLSPSRSGDGWKVVAPR